jgi:ADP-heptose:LPS heptosyltransferase
MSLALAKALDRRAGAVLAWLVGSADRVRETFAPPPPVEHVRRVLLVKFWGLGNWALLRPIVRDLRERHAGARVSIVTLPGNAPLAADLADELLLVRPRGVFAATRDLVRAARRLRREPPDLALDFEPFAHAGALLARCAGAAQRIGFASGGARDGLYTVTVPLRTDAHVARSFRDLAEAGGLAPAPYVPGALAAGADVVGRDYVLLHPGSGDNFPGRRWSEAGFAAVGRAARAAGCEVLVSGGADERELCARVAAAVPGARSVAGALSLDGLVALLARARALVSNDTGPVHLASALGVPTLALYGPNTPTLYGPLAPGSRAFYRGLACSPCLKASSWRSSRCRIFACMSSIPTGEVTAALGALLAAPAPASARSR